MATLAQHLSREHFKVAVLPFYTGGPVAHELRAAGVEVVSLEKKGRWDLPGFYRRLAGVAKRLQPDVICGFMDTANLCALALRPVTGARVVWNARTADIRIERFDWTIRGAFRLACRLSRRADLVICNSQAGRDFHLSQGYPPDKTIVIPNGIDTRRFNLDRAAREQVRAVWGVSAEEKLVGLAGRLEPVKDHPNFLRAAALLSAQNPAARFVCVGDGPAEYLAELQQKSARYGLSGKVIWSSGRDDMPAVYNALDALALASWSEGFPNVVAEAMACGVPCVVTDVGDAAEIVGETELVAPAKDASALADALARALAEPPPPGLLRERITTLYDARKLADNFAQAVDRLFDG